MVNIFIILTNLFETFIRFFWKTSIITAATLCILPHHLYHQHPWLLLNHLSYAKIIASEYYYYSSCCLSGPEGVGHLQCPEKQLYHWSCWWIIFRILLLLLFVSVSSRFYSVQYDNKYEIHCLLKYMAIAIQRGGST